MNYSQLPPPTTDAGERAAAATCGTLLPTRPPATTFFPRRGRASSGGGRREGARSGRPRHLLPTRPLGYHLLPPARASERRWRPTPQFVSPPTLSPPPNRVCMRLG
ncbi:hypothetical protein BRADI_2g31735v3 [Brachypodium distachyon]|uniref:Uncharacterized protein n=1 Tax=Brachypodium distachyon TaxID=15368 RepID=A0A2K2DBD7_BRADI|nr:hypothetical protein BRADI_2g31735v3 [Brachypodium distachyon]